MKYVLDSSVAVKWVLKEVNSDKAEALREDFRNCGLLGKRRREFRREQNFEFMVFEKLNCLREKRRHIEAVFGQVMSDVALGLSFQPARTGEEIEEAGF